MSEFTIHGLRNYASDEPQRAKQAVEDVYGLYRDVLGVKSDFEPVTLSTETLVAISSHEADLVLGAITIGLPTRYRPNVVSINQLAVAKSHQRGGLGIGRRLAEQVPALAARWRASRVELMSDSRSTGFYEKLGYKPAGASMYYEYSMELDFITGQRRTAPRIGDGGVVLEVDTLIG